MPPPFVVIEGLDGAGTTTQTRRVQERLESMGQGCATTQEPSEGPIGAMIRQMLSSRIVAPSDQKDDEYTEIGRETLALLFAADRLDHLRTEVEPLLEAGNVVVSDRYYHSSFAYQGDPVDEADGPSEKPALDLSWVRTLNERARQPDLTIFLEASPELCMERLGQRHRRDTYEREEKLHRLAGAYEVVLEELEDAGESIVRMDASKTPEKLTDQIVDAIAESSPPRPAGTPT